ncbi:hypothetical protein DFS34DRAFT_605474 [Phlyctochytrium arcticum]|nr:hypothetical protein DFS34DRAFT_605474 [Phlyctochytrium arcticum]
MRAGLVSTQPGPTPLTPHTSCRLYIGNLAPNLTEYVLLKMFQSHGIVRKIDYLWHKHGPKKGQPRGYCFLEYESPVSAARAIRVLDGRMFEGRKLVVGYSVDHEAVEFGGRLVNAPRRIGVLSMSGRGRGGHKGRWVESDEPVNQQLQLRSSSHSKYVGAFPQSFYLHHLHIFGIFFQQ